MVQAQYLHELESNAGLTREELKHIPQIQNNDTLNEIYYSNKKGYPVWYIGFTTTYFEGAKILGCKGDFNQDSKIDYAIYVRNLVRKKDQFRVYITGIDSAITLTPWHKTYKQALKEYPDRTQHILRCYEKSDTGIFLALYEKYEMPADVITLGWYSYVWNNQQKSFNKILTSD